MAEKKNFEIIVRQVEKGKVIKESLIKEIQVSKPKSIMDIGFRHSEQVAIISGFVAQIKFSLYFPLPQNKGLGGAHRNWFANLKHFV